MAKPKKLKVFRTPIGFHDAYVAAPSQKAALEAWGTDTNLFARGAAEQVTDPELTKEPLEHPGEVIKRLRGSEAEQIAALGKAAAGQEDKGKAPSPGPASAGGRKGKGSAKAKAKAKPEKPSRAELDAAEERLAELDAKQGSELREIDREIEALEQRRRGMQRRHESEHDEISQQRDRVRSAYERAMRRWRKA